ncbi:uncharacterized protein LOC129596502 [Paramacrobiotus metropolitanus]|uniref:uncharacterized protein LOC129596502 n=1 Tax=Paramacrobiotus metropolitanus TaxID=2943436 RepID=UPI00244644C3|nr:uncharacterized protein LOC129596502 [Paramacrobiotus metropolitanus]
MALLRDEKKNTLEGLFEIFKERNNDSVEGIQCIFVVKDFAQIAALEKSFPAAPVLLRAFHTMKAWKTKIATYTCSCYTKCKFGLPCRHILYLRKVGQMREAGLKRLTKRT